jgi:hypothetical protein
MRPAHLLLALASTFPALTRAQSLAARIAALGDGAAELRYPSKPRICGDGVNVISVGGNSWGNVVDGIRVGRSCEHGPARVTLSIAHGTIERLRVAVGREPVASAPRTELGDVSAAEAVRWLLAVAGEARGSVGESAIDAAMFADTVVPWPRLDELARDASLPRVTRAQATFWLERLAAAKVAGVADWTEIDDGGEPADDERAQAVFALSQMPKAQSVPALLEVARTHRDPAIRRRAMFWLGQTDDPCALDLFVEILKR